MMAGRRGRRRLARGAAIVAAAGLVAAGSGCGSAKDSQPDLVTGKQLFVAKCGSCHVLARAGSQGVTGPNLDMAFARSLADGFTRDTVKGVVHKQILYPDPFGAMPAKLVTGQDAKDVAAYVAASVANPGQDTGLLASAVPTVQKSVAVAKAGKLQIDANPTGQLAYQVSSAKATPGTLTINSKNASSVPHDIALQGNGVNAAGKIVQNGGVSTITVTVRAGTYTFFCTVPGHRQAGMQGQLKVG